MKRCIAGLLALLLAACSEPQDPPAPDPDITEPELQLPAAELVVDDFHELRSRWLELERPALTPLEPEPLPEVAETPLPVPEPAEPQDRTPAVAIIIDDVGHNLRQGRRLIALPLPVALAILPQTLAAEQLAREAVAAGRTVLLHQPMENGAGLSIGPGGMYSGMSRERLQAQLRGNLDSLPGVRGVNNHMGSRLTAEREPMDWVMQVLHERGLFFIDSRTTAQTQAAIAAAAAGVPHLSRQVFLDNQRTPEAIGQAFDQALAIARRTGTAVMIGHPYPQTIDYLEQRLTEDLPAIEGVRVVSVEELLGRGG